jgi:hypothetical protein
MHRVHTFRAKDGSGAGASSLEDGSNLPGGAGAWVHQATLDPAEMVMSAGVIGVGNAAEILDAVERDGFFYAPNGGRTTGGRHAR